MEYKTCNRCGQTFELTTGFHSNSQMKDGYFNQCKECKRRSERKNKDDYTPKRKYGKTEPKQKYQRKCATCGTSTSNYRCAKCWSERKEAGEMSTPAVSECEL